MLQQARDLRKYGEVNQATTIKNGNLMAPQYSLSGKITQKNSSIGDKERIDYNFILILTDIVTGLVLWDDEVLISKVMNKKQYQDYAKNMLLNLDTNNKSSNPTKQKSFPKRSDKEKEIIKNIDIEKLKVCKNEQDKRDGCMEITIETIQLGDKEEKITNKIPYYKNQRIKMVRQYYSDNRLFSEVPIENGMRNGVSREYYKNGNLKSETTFKNDNAEERAKWYYENGNLKYETPHKNGLKEGIKKTYYKNGNLKAEVPYRNDRIEGTERQYSESGNLLVEFPYRNGKVNGIAKGYYKNGNIMEEVPYKNNKIEGIVRLYYASRNLVRETPYRNGKKEGDEQHYYHNGDLVLSITYQNNETISGKCTNGKILNNAHINNINNIKSESDYQTICAK